MCWKIIKYHSLITKCHPKTIQEPEPADDKQWKPGRDVARDENRNTTSIRNSHHVVVSPAALRWFAAKQYRHPKLWESMSKRPKQAHNQYTMINFDQQSDQVTTIIATWTRQVTRDVPQILQACRSGTHWRILRRVMMYPHRYI